MMLRSQLKVLELEAKAKAGAFFLNRALIGKYRVLKQVVQVRTNIFQPLRLVGLSYQLAVGGSTVGPAK